MDNRARGAGTERDVAESIEAVPNWMRSNGEKLDRTTRGWRCRRGLFFARRRIETSPSYDWRAKVM
jgi:hypothetical protein